MSIHVWRGSLNCYITFGSYCQHEWCFIWKITGYFYHLFTHDDVCQSEIVWKDGKQTKITK